MTSGGPGREWFHNLREGGIPRDLAKGIRARVFPGTHLMLSVVEMEPWSESPVHAHPNEQWGVCLEGEWIRIQDGREYPVKAGDFWETPPNVPHGGRTLGRRCVVLDVFAPPREEYRRPGSGYGGAPPGGRPGCSARHSRVTPSQVSPGVRRGNLPIASYWSIRDLEG